jgi:hypothetical protein
MARSSASARVLTDPNEIREWAEERGAKPACVKGTGGNDDVGMIRLDFPGYSGADSLQPISWDDWARKFEESDLALLVQDETARGEQSNFNKLVSRRTAQQSSRSRRSSGGTGSRGRSRNSGTKRVSGTRTGRTNARSRKTSNSRSRQSSTSSKSRRKSTRSENGRSARKTSAVRGSSARKSSSRGVGKRSTSSSSSQRRPGRKAA